MFINCLSKESTAGHLNPAIFCSPIHGAQQIIRRSEFTPNPSKLVQISPTPWQLIIIVVMIHGTDIKRPRKFKDIQRVPTHKTNLSHSPSEKQNTSHSNTCSFQKSPLKPSLSFKRLIYDRSQEESIVSPTKLKIDISSIQSISLSSKTKAEVLDRVTPSALEKQVKPDLIRKCSTNSNKTDTSYKKGSYSQFSQLASLGSFQNKPKVGSETLCFGLLQKKKSENFAIPKKSALNTNKRSNVYDLRQLKAIYPRHQAPWKKQGWGGEDGRVGQPHVSESIIRQPQIQSHHCSSILQETDHAIPNQPQGGLELSPQTVNESVRVSVDFSNHLDMSPFI